MAAEAPKSPSYLVLAAMAVEAEALMDRLPLDGLDVTVTVTGIGKVAAASTCARLLAERPRDGVVVAGISGGLTPSAGLGTYVVADAAAQHDLDVRPLVDAPGIVPELGIARFEAAPEPTRYLAELAPSALRGLVVSGDAIIRSSEQRALIHERFPDALAVDMETAAIAHVCHLSGVPWSAVRVISDSADDQLDVSEVLAFAVETAGTIGDIVLETVQRWAR